MVVENINKVVDWQVEHKSWVNKWKWLSKVFGPVGWINGNGQALEMVDIKITVATENEKYEHNKIGSLPKNKFFLPVCRTECECQRKNIHEWRTKWEKRKKIKRAARKNQSNTNCGQKLLMSQWASNSPIERTRCRKETRQRSGEEVVLQRWPKGVAEPRQRWYGGGSGGLRRLYHALPEMAARVAAGKASDSQGADGLLSPRGVSKS